MVVRIVTTVGHGVGVELREQALHPEGVAATRARGVLAHAAARARAQAAQRAHAPAARAAPRARRAAY